MKRVVIAPDSFKGTISARPAADAIAAGWREVRPFDVVLLRPMADGGEGTIDVFASAVPGACRMPVKVQSPVEGGPDIQASWLLLPDRTGVVELAACGGLSHVDPPRPLDAHTGGLGAALDVALISGAERVLVGLGGSASSDGGAGLLTALGARLLDGSGNAIGKGNRGLADIRRVDLGGLRARPPRGVFILGDVSNPLLGMDGAAAVFGRQKGAGPGDIVEMEANLANFASAFAKGVELAKTPGAGAAGGAGFGLLVWGAHMRHGAGVVAEATGLSQAIEGSDLVITGEGRFDGQSASGKAPTEVARASRLAGVPVALIAGAVTAAVDGFAAAVSLSELAGSRQASMLDPAQWLRAAGRQLASAMP